MRFYKVTSTHNQNEINDIIKSMSTVETDYIIKIYGQISMVEYTDEDGFECMFSILDDSLIEKMSELYQKYSLKFTIIDLTNDVIFDNPFNIKYKNEKGKSVVKDVLNLIKEYKKNWITKDDILDKIIDKGIDSLTKFDLSVLKS
jgi:hypothetical protein